LLAVRDILLVPAAIPDTTPVLELTVATPVVLLPHVPLLALDNDVVVVAQTLLVPLMVSGVAFTVSTLVTEQPEIVYVFATMPAATPVTIPVEAPIVATSVLLLLHVPPPVLVSVVLKPEQTEDAPVIADGIALTVIVFVAEVAVGVTIQE
jgi:hypothetical protein